MASGEVEKLEDMIVRAAETTAAHVAAAKNSIGAVIFGQEQVVEQTLITVLSGGHGMLVGVPGLAKTKLVEALGTVLGLDPETWSKAANGDEAAIAHVQEGMKTWLGRMTEPTQSSVGRTWRVAAAPKLPSRTASSPRRAPRSVCRRRRMRR